MKYELYQPLEEGSSKRIPFVGPRIEQEHSVRITFFEQLNDR